ncbi:MAG: hypothetical protein M3Y93_11775 [Pseudomonadota bacterium]|nr:hypothetical protein [Pseudomonadota bacterium]
MTLYLPRQADAHRGILTAVLVFMLKGTREEKRKGKPCPDCLPVTTVQTDATTFTLSC